MRVLIPVNWILFSNLMKAASGRTPSAATSIFIHLFCIPDIHLDLVSIPVIHLETWWLKVCIPGIHSVLEFEFKVSTLCSAGIYTMQTNTYVCRRNLMFYIPCMSACYMHIWSWEIELGPYADCPWGALHGNELQGRWQHPYKTVLLLSTVFLPLFMHSP